LVHEKKALRDLKKLLMHSTRLALLVVLATADVPVTLSQLEKILGIPKQTVHSHLEAMVKTGAVSKKWIIADRPRVVYRINEKRVDEVLTILKYIRENIDNLEKMLSAKFNSV